jgi:hypothetical protein
MMKHMLAALIATSGFSGAAAAQTAAPACDPPKIAGEKLTLSQVPGTEQMTVPVAINGTGKQFLLDIGTAPDEVAQTTVADLHLPYFQQRLATNAFAGQNVNGQFNAAVVDVKSAGAEPGRNSNQEVVSVSSFAVAGATVPNLQIPVANDRDMGTKAKPYDGRFTGALFPQYDFNFDFGAKQMSFVDPTKCTDPNQVAYWPHTVVAVVPMTVENGKMTVPVTIGGHTVNAVVDLGSDHTVIRKTYAQDTLGLGSKDMTPDGNREDGSAQQIYIATIAQISFGGVIASNVPVRVQANSMVRPLNRTPVLGSRATFNADPAQRIPDLTLGMDVLHQLHVYAAFNQNKLYITPAG